MEETRLMQQRRGSPEGGRRQPPFGCRRHPDAKPMNKLQTGQFKMDVRLYLRVSVHLIFSY